MNLGDSIRVGVKWLIIGNTGMRLFEFVFGVILARLLVPADFGMIVTIQVFTGFVSMITSGGMGQALIRAKHVDSNDFNAVFTLQLGLGALIYLAFFFISPWFAAFFENPLYKDLMRVSAIMFLMRPFGYMHGSWLNREMDFKKRSIIGIIAGIATGVSSVLMAWFGMGVWSLTLSGLIGGLLRNILLSRVTPLSLRLSFDTRIMRKHGAYGSKIVANDFLNHVKNEALKLMLSKLAGPAFLGLFNKADSLHRLPYRTFAQPVAQPLFRAMSKVQDNLDQTKYMFHRVITLLMVYILPFFVGLHWVGKPFIEVVYGDQWVPAGKPLEILSIAGFFYIITRPCGVVLMAQNRLVHEMVIQGLNLAFTITACYIGLEWGLTGVSWAFLASQIFAAACYYFIVYRTIPTRVSDLAKAISPGLLINSMLYLVLAFTDYLTGTLIVSSPALYLVLMIIIGAGFYAGCFFFLPIPTLKTEVARWRAKISEGFNIAYQKFTS